MAVFRKIIDKTIDTTVAISLSVVFIVAFAQVISRYVFKLTIPWSTDIIRLAFIYTIFLGATIGVREKAHLNIDVVFNILPKRVQKILSILINIIIGAFLVFLVVKGIHFVRISSTQGMPYLQISMSVLYFAIPLNAVFMLYYLAQQIGEQLLELKDVK